MDMPNKEMYDSVRRKLGLKDRHLLQKQLYLIPISSEQPTQKGNYQV